MENELCHYGIHGMRWGIRRYQNKDGTLTTAGQKRYRKELARLKNEEVVLKNRKKVEAKFEKLNSKRKELDDMRDELSGKRSKKVENIDKPKELSDQELAQKVARLRMEKDRLDLERQISELTPKKISVGKQMIEKFGPTIVRTLWNDVGKPNINNFIKKIPTDDDMFVKGGAMYGWTSTPIGEIFMQQFNTPKSTENQKRK